MYTWIDTVKLKHHACYTTGKQLRYDREIKLYGVAYIEKISGEKARKGNDRIQTALDV